MNIQELTMRLEALGPHTTVEVVDLTGTNDHYQASIASPLFKGRSIIEQHRDVFALVKKELESGEIHALSLKTKYIP